MYIIRVMSEQGLQVRVMMVSLECLDWKCYYETISVYEKGDNVLQGFMAIIRGTSEQTEGRRHTGSHMSGLHDSLIMPHCRTLL